MLDSLSAQSLTFLLELFFIFLLSKHLQRTISQSFYNLTHSLHKTVGLMAFLFLPGTIVHELAHVLVAGALLVGSDNIEFMPEVREDGVKLGSATIHKTDPLRRTIIGVAPVLVGLSLILALAWYAASVLLNSPNPWWMYLLIAYLIFELSNTMFSSKKDMEGSLIVFALLISILIALYLLGFLDLQALSASSFGLKLKEVLNTANIFLLIPLLLDMGVLGILKLMHKKIRL